MLSWIVFVFENIVKFSNNFPFLQLVGEKIDVSFFFFLIILKAGKTFFYVGTSSGFVWAAIKICIEWAKKHGNGWITTENLSLSLFLSLKIKLVVWSIFKVIQNLKFLYNLKNRMGNFKGMMTRIEKLIGKFVRVFFFNLSVIHNNEKKFIIQSIKTPRAWLSDVMILFLDYTVVLHFLYFHFQLVLPPTTAICHTYIYIHSFFSIHLQKAQHFVRFISTFYFFLNFSQNNKKKTMMIILFVLFV